ncbi:hypothetical protein A2767_04430 [Candidatus Roizmanbacteria bacterium RIFCSPHIGHO2_01_FULL_35_10]|uniref:Glycosyltransferase RgtA/B/C/D-like domain-containing protein n=1 Tax=Candidatus Roizmanbacteria bacterium RIFCSPLOWO2_01_FULL_35_13 TaxID=1802055 RepID=A0A1F7I6N3_9BACT|nr:MAG: hypothetical protein A2767_04430 [Candidatus Roizmanbacteria bacterium RIFCSPHIGHO2_01_FULL_35_10]OGK39029.1 MAG: hypothetical protein A3A74_04545 [Candidatus Roizmanbacteria bacterium RIFCSPLOWO2_01_FULL_35_13]
MLLFIYTFFSFFLIWIVAERKLNIQFKYIVIFAFVLRIFVTFLFLISKSDDINTFIRDGRYLLTGSVKYEASYFPFISYLGAAAVILKNYIHPYIFLKIIFTIFDVLVLFPLYYLSKKNLQSALIYALNPISIIVINIHGQMDSIPMFFFLTGLVLFLKNRILASILTISFAIYTKPWPLLFILPLFKKTNNKILFIFLGIFPLLGTFIHSIFFAVPFSIILGKVKDYRGIFGAWGLSKMAVYLLDYHLNPLVESAMRRVFLLSFFGFSYFQKEKDILRSVLISMLFLFVFSPTFGIQWFTWLVPFVVIVRPKLWRMFLVIGSIYLTFGFAWDVYQYFRDIMPLWNSVITRVGFITWIFIIVMFFNNIKLTPQKR